LRFFFVSPDFSHWIGESRKVGRRADARADFLP
jgi:hypothetical protein